MSVSALSVASEVNPAPDQTLVDFVLARYAGCHIITKFYVEGSEEQVSKTDYLIGTDLKNMIVENKFTPFLTISCKICGLFSKFN